MAGLGTATSFDPLFRSPIVKAAELQVFTPNYETQQKLIGPPTRENLALKIQAEQTDALAREIAAKETPEAKKEREESGFFSSRSQERELAAQKEELQKAVEDNMLEKSVKADKYFLIKSDWDKKVIQAANGETVTVEYEDHDAPVNTDGTYPKKTIVITKSPKLKKISHDRPKKEEKTVSDVLDEYNSKTEALREKYSDGIETSDGVTRRINFDRAGRILKDSDALLVEQYKIDFKELTERKDREIAAINAKASTTPPSQGLNVEPHTIAIWAPGFCMESGCCLEHAYYTLRAAAKTIESDAEAAVESEIKDMVDANNKLHEEHTKLLLEADKLKKKAYEEAGSKAAELYKKAYQMSTRMVPDGAGGFRPAAPKPKMEDYTAEAYMRANPEEERKLMANYNDKVEEAEILLVEIDDSDTELDTARSETFERLTTDAKNYRLLLSKCTFQPICPEWLEDSWDAVASAAKATGEAIADAAEWLWNGGPFKLLDKVNGYINDGLAWVSELQDKLNEWLGFEGLCSLNPFGGTLGCANCPMGSKCSSEKKGLLDQIAEASRLNEFLGNLKGALGLNKGQFLGNLLQCAAALTGEVSGAISAVENFAISTGLSSVLGQTSNILNTSALPNFNTKLADCIGATESLQEINEAVRIGNTVAGGPLSVMQSNIPGIGAAGLDISKLDQLGPQGRYYKQLTLGEDKTTITELAANQLPVESPQGAYKYRDGKTVDGIPSKNYEFKMTAAKVFENGSTSDRGLRLKIPRIY